MAVFLGKYGGLTVEEIPRPFWWKPKRVARAATADRFEAVNGEQPSFTEGEIEELRRRKPRSPSRQQREVTLAQIAASDM